MTRLIRQRCREPGHLRARRRSEALSGTLGKGLWRSWPLDQARTDRPPVDPAVSDGTPGGRSLRRL